MKIQIRFVLFGFLYFVSAFLFPGFSFADDPSHGQKTLLFIRANFPEDPGPLPTDAALNATASAAKQEIETMSYGQFSFTWTIMPVTVTLPHPASYYVGLGDPAGGLAIENDIHALAQAQGYDYNQYSVDVTYYPHYFNFYWFGTDRSWFEPTNFNLGIYGLEGWFPGRYWKMGGRADGWLSNDNTVFGHPGSKADIQDPFDILGTEQTGVSINYNVHHKNRTLWIPDSNIPYVTTDGTYRIYAQDTESSLATCPGAACRYYGLRIPGYQGRDYWVEFRQSAPGGSGLLVNWGGTLLLDMTPGSSGGFNDAPLKFDQTFTDPDGVSIRMPSGAGGSRPQYVDVTVTGAHPILPQVTLTATPTAVTPGGAVTVSWSGATSATPEDRIALYHVGDRDYNWINRTFTTGTPSGSLSFNAPTEPGQYEFRFFSNFYWQKHGTSNIVTVGSPGNNNQAPSVNAGSDQTITLPASVNLNGSASDDGLPNPPGSLTKTWTKVSGPGTVTFANANALSTTASFSQAGTYVLRLTASDGSSSASDDMQLIVNPVSNQSPTVSAGSDQAITLPSSANLLGTVSDDGLPDPPGALTTTWSKVSGPGTVIFGDANALATSAIFSQAGTYVLRLTASDSGLSKTDDVQVTVNPVPNQPPTVSAGSDQAITLPSSANVLGSASDKGKR